MLGAKDFCEMMLAAQKESYGDGLSALHPYMWACKSHYYSPSLHFYNFPYAFGLLFGKGVFARYEKMGAKAFVPEYRALLKATATGDVEDVALGVGIDVKSPAFWRESLQSVRADIDRFCDMV